LDTASFSRPSIDICKNCSVVYVYNVRKGFSVKLYDFQEKCLTEIRAAFASGSRAPLLVSPTGSGKTVMFSAICKGATQRGNRVMILVHRQELIDQVCLTLRDFEVPHGIIAAQYPALPTAAVQVASVFSLVRRLASQSAPELIIIDEAHHAILASTWGKVISAYPRARLLGVTATPARLSGEGLGDIFDRLVVGPSVQTLIDSDRLSPVRVFAPPTIDTTHLHTQMGDFKKAELSERVDKPKVTGDAIEHYQKITPGQRAAVFCVSLEHAAHIASSARAAGITAVQIDGTMDRGLRRDVVKDFKNGHIQWLVTVDLISEGFDCPGIEVGICLRPTQSLGLWLQQCGRCLRTSPGKSHATILDHAGNSLRHGLPTEDRSWSLDGVRRNNARAEKSQSVRVCPKCFSAQRSGKAACANCGHTFNVESRTVGSEKGQLEEISAESIAARRERAVQGRSATLEQLTELGRIRGYRDAAAWARYVLAGREKKRAAR
jgi:DNA repair protein RadD